MPEINPIQVPKASDSKEDLARNARRAINATLQLLQGKIDGESYQVFRQIADVANGRLTGASGSDVLEKLKDKIGKTSSRAGSEDLRGRVKAAALAIIDNVTDPDQDVAQIPDAQLATVSRLKIKDQDRVNGLVIRYFYRPIRWLLGDRKSRDVYRREGNDCLENLSKAVDETVRSHLFRRAVKQYGKALKLTETEQQRIPIYFKLAQAYILRVKGEDQSRQNIWLKEALLFNDTIARSTYSQLRTQLLYLTEVVNKSTSVIQTVIKTLLGYESHFVEELRDGREQLKQYREQMPDLEPIKMALLGAPDLDLMPEVRVAIEDLPKEYNKPDELQKALIDYSSVIHRMQRLDISLKTSQILVEQERKLEVLDLSKKIYRQTYESVQIDATITKLISTVREFSHQIENGDILAYAEQHPEALVTIFGQLSLLDVEKIPADLIEFKEDMVAIRDSFLMRATASERIATNLCEFFEKLSSKDPEKVAKEALKSLRLPYSSSEDCFLMAYKDYHFASAMFNAAVTATKERKEKLIDAAFERELVGKTEEEQAGIWRDLIVVDTPAMREENDKLKQLAPFVKFCEDGITRVTNAVLDNPRISSRGKMLFSDFYGAGGEEAYKHIAAGNFYYVNSDKADPVEQHTAAIGEYQTALKMLLEQKGQEAKGKDKDRITARLKDVRNGLQRATHMKKAAEAMERVYALAKSPSKLAYNNKIDRQKVLKKLAEYLGEAYNAESFALYVDFEEPSVKGLDKQEAAKKQADAKEAFIKERAKTERTNFIDIAQMIGDLQTRLNDAKQVDFYVNNAVRYADRGLKSRGDFKMIDFDEVDRLIRKYNGEEAEENKIKADPYRRADAGYYDRYKPDVNDLLTAKNNLKSTTKSTTYSGGRPDALKMFRQQL